MIPVPDRIFIPLILMRARNCYDFNDCYHRPLVTPGLTRFKTP
jgi:hypothetical protein